MSRALAEAARRRRWTTGEQSGTTLVERRGDVSRQVSRLMEWRCQAREARRGPGKSGPGAERVMAERSSEVTEGEAEKSL